MKAQKFSSMDIGVGFISHNRIDLTRETFEALQNHDFQSAVVIDNASEDGVLDYLQERARSDDRVAVVSNHENVYPGAARNQIVEHLLDRSDLIVFHDNDVFLGSGCLAAVREIFSELPSLGQLTALRVPDDLVLEHFEVAGHPLAKSISCAASPLTVVRAELFRQDLSWRESEWIPEGNKEIGEDYFFSRKVKNMGFLFCWFAPGHPCCGTNLGRSKDDYERNLDYYLKTFGDRGMLSRLLEALPHRRDEIEAYAQASSIPELHQRFSLETELEPSASMSGKQVADHWRNYQALLPRIRRLVGNPSPSLAEYSEMCVLSAACREYFDGIEEGHPLFSQRTLQAALFFNRLYWKSRKHCAPA